MESIIALTVSEYERLYEDITTHMQRPSQYWRKAFDQYNSDTGSHLGVFCMSCYKKVFDHITTYYFTDTYKRLKA